MYPEKDALKAWRPGNVVLPTNASNKLDSPSHEWEGSPVSAKKSWATFDHQKA